MKNVTEVMHEYLEAKRHLWNVYFRKIVTSLYDCGALDDFEEIDSLLFSSLALRRLGIDVDGSYAFGRDPLSELVVKPRNGVNVWPVMVSNEGEGNWSSTFELPIADSDVFLFINFFEWNQYGSVSYPYLLCKIESSLNAEVKGKLMLIEAAHAEIFLRDTSSFCP